MTFAFDRGPYAGKRPDEAPDSYLLEVHGRLRQVPEGHELRGVFDAVVEELRARGNLPDEVPNQALANPEIFRVPPPLPAAEHARRARAAKAAAAAGANGHATETAVGAPAASHTTPGRPTALMPCGHPTADLEPVQGSWRGVCRGCARLGVAAARLRNGDEPADVLLEFEAEIRGYKPAEST